MHRLSRVTELDSALASMAAAVDRLATGLRGSADGLREVGSASDDGRALREEVARYPLSLPPPLGTRSVKRAREGTIRHGLPSGAR